MNRLGRLVLLTAVVAGLHTGAAHADNDPSNNSCSTPEPVSTGTYYYGGVSYPGDYQDFYSFTATAGQYVSVTMNPGYTSGTGEVHATIHGNPSCYVVAFDYQVGTAIESPSFVAPYTGTYYLEIWAQWGYGYYDFFISRQSPGATRSCSSSSVVGIPGVPSCTVTFPFCPTASCSYDLDVTMNGAGTVEGIFGNAHCSGINTCTGYGWASSPASSEVCLSGPGTLAANASISCRVRLTSF